MSEVVIIVQHALCLAVTLDVGGGFALEKFLKMAEKVRRASDKAHTSLKISSGIKRRVAPSPAGPKR